MDFRFVAYDPLKAELNNAHSHATATAAADGTNTDHWNGRAAACRFMRDWIDAHIDTLTTWPRAEPATETEAPAAPSSLPRLYFTPNDHRPRTVPDRLAALLTSRYGPGMFAGHSFTINAGCDEAAVGFLEGLGAGGVDGAYAVLEMLIQHGALRFEVR